MTRKDMVSPDNFLGENKQQEHSVIGLSKEEIVEANYEEDQHFIEMVNSIPEINKEDVIEDSKKGTDVQEQSNFDVQQNSELII